MGIEDLIRDALHQPYDYVGYHVSRKLAELHPDKTILQGRNSAFDLDDFVRAGKCAVVEQRSVFLHATRAWQGINKKQKRLVENGWLNVLWRGELLDVILITYNECGRRTRHHWIVADTEKFAEDFLDAVCAWSCEVRGEILVYQDGEFEKDRELFEAIKSANFDNLILPAPLKQQLREDFVQFFNSRATYERYGIPWRRGSLFIGPPGNGKTHAVKALINHLGQPCLYVRSFCGYDEESEQENIARLFARARMLPCIVVLEDVDSMITDKNRAVFLNELDGFRTNTGVAVLATTNHPEKLDVAILDRPSRFDRKYYFNLPAETERCAYVQNWNRELQPELRLSDTTSAVLVEQTEGFSFAYLKELFVSSMAQWMTNAGRTQMNEVVIEQVNLLRRQLQSAQPPSK